MAMDDNIAAAKAGYAAFAKGGVPPLQRTLFVR